jgi:hypothetical protein
MTRAAEAASALPLIRWRGWRPKPLDLERNEQGGQVFLVFDREDDLALLPTATMTFLVYEPLGDGSRWEDHGIDPIAVSHSAAAARHVIEAAIDELAADGWQVIGRLQATFHGIDTEDDFWARLDCAMRDADEGDNP